MILTTQAEYDFRCAQCDKEVDASLFCNFISKQKPVITVQRCLNCTIVLYEQYEPEILKLRKENADLKKEIEVLRKEVK
jgi:hypothetical protein